MVWTPVWPIGSLSVEDNLPTGVGNTAYLKDKLEIDHYFGENGATDGFHKQVQGPKTESAPGTPSDVTVSASADGAYYIKQKTTVEQPGATQAILPYFTDALGSPAIMEILGIRSCGLVTVSSGAPYTITNQYKHNMTSITRSAVGVYDVLFPALPSIYYLPFVGVLRDAVAGQVATATLDPTLKTTTGIRIIINEVGNTTNDRVDPSQIWFMCFGG